MRPIIRRAISTLAEMELRDANRPTLRDRQEREVEHYVQFMGTHVEEFVRRVHRTESEYIAYADPA